MTTTIEAIDQMNRIIEEVVRPNFAQQNAPRQIEAALTETSRLGRFARFATVTRAIRKFHRDGDLDGLEQFLLSLVA